MTDRQRTDSIGRTVLQTVAQKLLEITDDRTNLSLHRGFLLNFQQLTCYQRRRPNYGS